MTEDAGFSCWGSLKRLRGRSACERLCMTAGEAVPRSPAGRGANPDALALFASGVDLHQRGDIVGALKSWRAALEIDPDNFLIRSQVWVVEHPEHFYPTVDRAWQERQLMREGYDQPLP